MVLGVIYGIVGLCLAASLWADREKTGRAVRIGWTVFKRLVSPTLAVVGIIGLLMGLVPQEFYAAYLGESAGFWGALGAAAVGAFTFIPSLIAFPLAGSVLHEGAAAMTVAAFVTTLTMVGVATFPLEARTLGLRFTLWRNALSFAFALVLAAAVGVILK